MSQYSVMGLSAARVSRSIPRFVLFVALLAQSHVSALELFTVWNKQLNVYPTTPPPSYELARDDDGNVIPRGYDLTAYGRQIEYAPFELTFLQTDSTTSDFDIACRPSLNADWLGSCAGLIAIAEYADDFPLDEGGFRSFASVFTFQNTYAEPFGYGMQTGHGVLSDSDNEYRVGHPQWVRLKRQGILITAFVGEGLDAGDIAWTQVGTQLFYADKFRIGMYATCRANYVLQNGKWKMGAPSFAQFRDYHHVQAGKMPVIETYPNYEDSTDDRVYLDLSGPDGLSISITTYEPEGTWSEAVPELGDYQGLHEVELLYEDILYGNTRRRIYSVKRDDLLHPFVSKAMHNYTVFWQDLRCEGQAYIERLPHEAYFLEIPQTIKLGDPYSVTVSMSSIAAGIHRYWLYLNGQLISSGTYDDVSDAVVTVAGGPLVLGTNTYTLKIANGRHNTDPDTGLWYPEAHPLAYQGTWLVRSATFEVDITPPQFISAFPAPGTYYNKRTVLPYGTYNEVVRQQSYTIDGANFVKPWGALFLKEGEHTVSEAVVDLAGNAGGATWSFFIDLTPPVIEILSPAQSATVSPLVPIVVKVTDAMAGVRTFKVYLDGGEVSGAFVNGNYTFTPQTPLTHGPHYLSIYADDNTQGFEAQPESNYSEKSISFYVDAEGPWIDVLGGLTFPTGAHTINGIVESDAMDVVASSATLLGVELFREVTPSTQKFTLDFVANTVGSHVIQITAQDMIGNAHFINVPVTIVENIDSDGDLVPDSIDTEPLVADSPPGITITAPSEGQLFNKQSNSIVTVAGVLTNDDDATITILVDNEVRASQTVPPGSYNIDVMVPDGSRSIRVIAMEDSFRQAISQQRSIVMDTLEPNFLDNEVNNSIASPVWLKGFVQDAGPHATGVVDIQAAGQPGLIKGVDNPNARFPWTAKFPELSESIDYPINVGPVTATDRAGNSATLYTFFSSDLAHATLVVNKLRRVAVQEGDILIMNVLPEQETHEFRAVSVDTDGSSVVPPVILYGNVGDYYYPYYYYAQCEKGRIPYPATGTDFELSFDVFKESDDSLVGRAHGLIDIYSLNMTPATMDIAGTTGNQAVPEFLLSDDPSLKAFRVEQPMRGDVPGLGVCTLKVYGGGKAVGMGDVRIWYDPTSTGVPAPGTPLVLYSGQPIPITAIDGAGGKAFYVQGIWKSDHEHDTAIVLEYDPLRTEVYDYKKLCTQVMRITVADSSARLLVDANHDGAITRETDLPYQTPRFGALFMRGFDTSASGLEHHLDYRARVPVKIDLDEGFSGPITLRADNEFVGVFLESSGGQPLFAKGEKTWIPPEKPPQFVYVEFPADDRVNLELISGTQKLTELKVTVFSNGLGADGMSPTATVLPGYSTVNLNTGNIHFSAAKESYFTPVMGPNLRYCYNHLDGMDRGNGRGWRSNYDVQIFDGSADPNSDETYELIERKNGDLLVVIDESGRRFPFIYSEVKQRFISVSQSGWINAEVIPPGVEGDYYKLLRFDNHKLYHNLNGLLTRVERSDAQELTIQFQANDQVATVRDGVEIRSVSVPLAVDAVFHGPRQLSGGQLPGIGLDYELSSGPVPIPRLLQITLNGNSSAMPTLVNGAFVQATGSVRAIFQQFELSKNRPQRTVLGTFQSNIVYGEGTSTAEAYSGGMVSVHFNKYLDAWTQITSPGGIQTDRDLDQSIRRPSIDSTGQQLVTYGFDLRGAMSNRTDNAGPSWARTYLDIPNLGVHLLETDSITGVGTTRYTYEWNFWIKSVTNAENETTSFTYSAPGFLTTKTDARSYVWAFSGHTVFGDYKFSHTPEGRTNARTLLTEYGLQTSSTDWLGYTNATSYDGQHRVVGTSKPGASASIAYDAQNRIVGSTDYSGSFVLQSRDVLGRATTIAQPGIGNLTITYRKDPTNIVSVATRVGGEDRRLSTTTYDFDGRTIKTAVPVVLQPEQAAVNAVTEFHYTAEGWPSFVVDPRASLTATDYNLGSRKIVVTTAGGGTNTSQYDEAWRLVSTTNADGETAQSIYDNANRVKQSINPAGGVVTTNYLPGGLVDNVELKDSVNGGVYGQPEYYGYDRDGLVINKTDRLGLQSTIAIDKVARSITTSTENQQLRTATSWLDGNANVNLVTTVLGNTSMTPTADGFVTSVTAPGRNSATQSRDSLNRVTSGSMPSGGSWSVQLNPITGDTQSSKNILDLTTTFNLAPQTGEVNSVTDNVAGVPSPKIAAVVRRDRNGNVLEFKDGMTRSWIQQFDDENRRTYLKAPDGTITRFTYTMAGRLETARDEKGVTTLKYHPLGLVKEVVDASLRKTVREYDSFGQMLSETRGKETTIIGYDNYSKLVTSRSTGSNRVDYARDRFGRIESTQDSKGNAYGYEYDDADRLLKVTYPDTKTERYEYQPNGPDIVAMIDRAGRRTEVDLDGAGRISQLRHLDAGGGQQTVNYSYNAANQVTAETLNGVSVARSYDGRGRLRSVTQPTGGVTYDYYNDDQVDTLVAPDGQRRYVYDAFGRLEQMFAPGGDARLTYDAKGRVETETLPNGVSRRYVYGQAGRVARMEQTLPGTAGPVTETYTYRYDAEGRLIRVGIPDGNYRYSYDAEGRLAEEVRVWQEPYSTSYKYDSNGNRTAVERYEQAATKTYNFSGTAMPAGATVQAGDWAVADGFASAAGSGFARLNLLPQRDTCTLYQARLLVVTAGMVDGEERRAGVTFGGDLDGRYGAYLCVKLNTGTLQQRVKIYYRDAAGIETLLQESGERAHTDGYWTLEVLVSDVLQARITQDTQATTLVRVPAEHETNGSVGLEAVGTHDVVGVSFDHFRWQGFTDEAKQWNYAYNALNQLLTVSGAENASYDYNDMGQLVQRTLNGVQTQYDFDRLGRMTSVNAPGLQQTFAYSGSSWMRQNATLNGVTTSFVYDGHNCVAQTTGGITTQYAFLGQRPLWETSVGATTTYLNDGQGSVGGLVSAAGVQSRFRYDAYGRLKSYGATGATITNTSGPRYKGELYDAASDQVYLRNRMYDPNVGRFSSLDPKGMVDGPNMYAYCGGDPVNKIDPMGTEIQIAGESWSGNERPLWSNPTSTDFILQAMIRSKNVYKFGSWAEARAIVADSENATWLLNDAGSSAGQIGTELNAYYGNQNALNSSAQLAADISQNGSISNRSSTDALTWDEWNQERWAARWDRLLDMKHDGEGLKKAGYGGAAATAMVVSRNIPVARVPLLATEVVTGSSTHGANYRAPLDGADRILKGVTVVGDVLSVAGPKFFAGESKVAGEAASVSSPSRTVTVQTRAQQWQGTGLRQEYVTRYHMAPEKTIDLIENSRVLRATDVSAPEVGVAKAWVTDITPQQLTGRLGWYHRMRLGFSPSKGIPTPHIRGGKMVYQVEDAFIEVQVPKGSLKRAPFWKAPLGGQEYVPFDIQITGPVTRGSI